jgi:hypothetical protein
MKVTGKVNDITCDVRLVLYAFMRVSLVVSYKIMIVSLVLIAFKRDYE